MLMFSWRVIPLFCVVLVVVRAGHGAQDASTQPAEQIKSWLADLSHRDAEIREQAFDSLVRTKRDDLPLLRQAAASARPISPTQAPLLREIVSHIYLSGEPYEADPTTGFLGLQGPDPGDRGTVVVFENENSPAQLADGSGVPIVERLAGFGGFAALRTGDIVLGIAGSNPRRLTIWEELVDSIKKTLPGETLEFDLLRDGRQIRVAVKINARPLNTNLDREQIEQWRRDRQSLADEYWEKDFAPLLEGESIG